MKPVIWMCNRCSWSTMEPFTGLRHAIEEHGIGGEVVGGHVVLGSWSDFLASGRYVDVVCPLCRGDGPVGQPTRYQGATCPMCLGRGYVDRRELTST